MRKPLLTMVLIGLMISGLAFVGSLHFGTTQSSTNVSGIINTDTTWIEANSPYTLTGPFAVAAGVTLTINPGVTINLGSYYIIVNGTMQAIGTNTDKIEFTGGQIGTLNSMAQLAYPITFAPTSSSWNEQTGSGCIIENAFLDGTMILINDASPKIYNNRIDGGILISGDSTGEPIISDNYLINTLVPGCPLEDDSSDHAVISNNTLTTLPSPSSASIGLSAGVNDVVFGNVISNSTFGISAAGLGSVISNNVISNCKIGVQFNIAYSSCIIENNLITNCSQSGIIVGSGPCIIQNNTITDNYIGIQQPSSQATMIYNNFENNSQSISLVGVYSFGGISTDVNAAYNWWGTTNQQAINQTIYDFKNNFNLGTVNFIPFLTAPNTEAMPNPNAPILIPAPTSTPSISPFNNQTLTQSQTPPFLTRTAPPNSTSSASPNSSTSSSQSYLPNSSLTTELIIAAVAIAFVAATIGAFLLGKRTGDKKGAA